MNSTTPGTQHAPGIASKGVDMKKLNKRVGLMTTTCATFALVLATLGAGTLSVHAQASTDQSNPQLFFEQTNHIKATIEDIDYAKRHITLKEPDGTLSKFAVSDQVKNFPQLKKGDQVNIGFYESVLLTLHKPGETAPPPGSSTALVTRPSGEKPGGMAMSVTDITATVENVDRNKREVTLKGPEGHLVNVMVDPQVGDLSRIKKGDRISAQRTEQLAISVEAP